MAVDLQILNRAAEKIQIAMGLKLLQLRRSAYIEGLMRWIKIKGIASDNNVVKGIAFAIATKQTSKGGWGKGNPMDKGKLGFLEKTKAERDEIVRTQIAPAYQAEIISLVTKDLSGRFDLII